MAIATVLNQIWKSLPDDVSDTTQGTCDASGESLAAIGTVRWRSGPGSTKTISSSGGVIWWRTGTAQTFANAGSAFRVGIQDIGATGLEDGSYDVHAELIGGTDTIGTSIFLGTAMESGSKSIADGAQVAVVLELVTRGGADSVTVDRVVGEMNEFGTILPYGTADTGTLAKAAQMPWIVLQADDGTMGWIEGMGMCAFATTEISFNSGSNPDEYMNAFTVPVPMQISGVGIVMGNVASTDVFDLVIYSDPYGTPSTIETITVDPNKVNTTIAPTSFMYPCATVTLQPGTTYGIALRPIVSSVSFSYFDLGSGNDELKALSPFGSVSVGARVNAGTFAVTQAYHFPIFYLSVCGLDDGRGVAEAGYQMGVI